MMEVESTQGNRVKIIVSNGFYGNAPKFMQHHYFRVHKLFFFNNLNDQLHMVSVMSSDKK